MATVGPTARNCSNVDDATFRNWGSWISAGLATIGHVKTADTGQINWATVLKPSIANASQGYEIWRFDDGLQATAPVFFKIEFGSGASANTPAIWITTGTGSDGAGNLTGVIGTRAQFQPDPAGIGIANCSCYLSGSSGRLSLAMFYIFGAGQPATTFSVNLERSKDVAGADTNEGLIFQGRSVTSWSHQFVPFFGGSFGTVPSRVTGARVFAGSETTGSSGADVALWPNVVTSKRGMEQPGMGYLGYWNVDLVDGNVVPVTVYGGAHNYLPMHNIQAGNSIRAGSGSDPAGSAMAMRFE